MSEKKVQKHKIDAANKLQEGFSQTRSFLFADYRGLNVPNITELRKALREVDAEFHVIKNSFAKIAFSRIDHDDVQQHLTGPTALAYCRDEAGPVAKVMLKLGKEMPLVIKGGLIDGNVYSPKEVEDLSKLPGKLELIQMLMGAMNAPVGNVAYALNGVVTKLVRTVDAVRESKA